jgi:hypothetical protein
MLDRILGRRIDGASSFRGVTLAAHVRSSLALFLGQQCHDPRSLGRIRRFADKPAISLDILSGDKIVYRSLPKAIGRNGTLRPFRRGGKRNVRYRTFYSTWP